jgi:hypothetical protein
LLAWKKLQNISEVPNHSETNSLSSPPNSTTSLINGNNDSILPSSSISCYSVSTESTGILGENSWQKKLYELTSELEKIKQELTEEKIVRKSVEEEKLLFQQDTINAQKQLIAALNKDNKFAPYRNILLIGRTGNGKSTLANVLTNRRIVNDDKKKEKISRRLVREDNKCYKCKRMVFSEGKEWIEAYIEEQGPYLFHEECFNFKESSGSVSETRETQMEEFEHNRIKYKVIDTVGIGDTKLTEEQVLDKIAEVAYMAKEGINRILFVVGRRFTDEETDTYDKLVKEFKLDENIGGYITIVRTHYPDFNNKLACEKDRESLRNENPKLKRILSSAKIVYVDNDPKLDELRDQSRTKLLKHLEKNSQKSYKPLGFEELVDTIEKPMEKKRQLRETINNLNNSVEGVDKKEVKTLEKEIKNQEEVIREPIQQYLEKKGINWVRVMELGIGSTTALATIATVVVAVACRIM